MSAGITGADTMLQGILGPFVVGALVSMYCSGLVHSQVRRYFVSFPKDRTAFRYGVIILLLFDIATTVFASHSAWDLAVKGWGVPSVLIMAPTGFALNPAAAGVITLIVQTFYAHRVYIVSGRRWYISAAIIILGFVQLGFACGATVVGFQSPMRDFVALYEWGVYAWLLSAFAADIMITGTIVWHLQIAWRRGQKNGFKSSRVFKQVVRVTLESNLGTALVALVDAIMFSKLESQWHVTMNLLLSKAYIISFLYTLNSRLSYSANGDEVNSVTYHASRTAPTLFARDGGITSAGAISAQLDRASVASMSHVSYGQERGGGRLQRFSETGWTVELRVPEEEEKGEDLELGTVDHEHQNMSQEHLPNILNMKPGEERK